MDGLLRANITKIVKLNDFEFLLVFNSNYRPTTYH